MPSARPERTGPRALAARLVALFCLLAWPALAQAQLRPAGPVLAAADLRPAYVLDGEWNWSVDPFRTGLTGFHGSEAGKGARRYDDTDVAQARAADPYALYEYDLDRAAKAQLPGSWIGHAREMRHYQGLVWYQRRFDASPGPGRRQFLRFGAADFAARVWLNGRFLGEHRGGFTPFAFEVTGLLRPSGNRLVVGIDSLRTTADVPPPITDWEDYGGLTRSVRLIEVPETYVDDAWVRLDRAGKIAIDVALSGPQAADRAVTLRIPELGLVLRGRADAAGRWHGEVAAPRQLRRWSPESPRLYGVAVDAGEDRWHDRIGFRTVEARGSQILLNGKPVFLRGISLHAEELGAQPSRRIGAAEARALLLLARDGLNANYVRLAHYPHGEEMLRAADELGLIVWSEVPVYWLVDFASPETLAQARRMLAENLLRDRNRAAIALWSVANETPVGPARNAFLTRLVEDVRALDDTRLVSAALLTGSERGAIVIADPLAAQLDVLAVNTYNGWYGDARLTDLAGMVWRMPADKPLLISEFGADARAGLRDSQAVPHKFSEEFQADYYRQTLAMLDKVPTMAGMSPWILKDFRSPRRQLSGVQDGWNRKGLVSESGQRKQAFAVLADYYRARAAQR